MPLVQKPITVFLCLILMSPCAPGMAQASSAPEDQDTKHTKVRRAYQSDQLNGDDRILHALNRFTFGPRPGDLETVRAIGINRWFDQQLHPGSLNQSDLEVRLAQFPAMQHSTEELLFRFPSNAIIRQAVDGTYPIPAGGMLRAVYENQIFRTNEKKVTEERKQLADQKARKQPSSPSAGPMNSSAAMDGNSGKTENAARMSKEPMRAAGVENETSAMNMPHAGSELATVPIDDSSINSLLALPPPRRVARLAAMPQPEFDSMIKALKPAQRAALGADLDPNLRELVGALENPQRLVTEELMAQRLTRAVYSSAQLQEVMTDFWLNHFNIFLHKNEATPYYLVSYERDVIRPLALGKFEDLLEATAHSPAMLLYLDNASNTGPGSLAADRAKAAAWRGPENQKKAPKGLNENYARELMELHTFGVNGGYTQADVTQVARIFTGWTVDRPQRGGGFNFDANRHEPGTKTVLGRKFKERGEMEGRELLHMLVTRLATAQFLSHKLAVRFVSDDPPQSLLDRMAKSYLSSGGDISAVLKTLFNSPEFWSVNTYRTKVKTPIEYVVSAVRASNATVDNLRPLANALRELGMPLYGCVPPTGYSWQSSAWVSTGTLVDRMNFALALAANRLPGIKVTWSLQQDRNSARAGSVPNPDASSPLSEESRLESLLVAGGTSVSTRSAVLKQYLEQNAGKLSGGPISAEIRPATGNHAAQELERQDQVLAGLLLGSPEFQRR